MKLQEEFLKKAFKEVSRKNLISEEVVEKMFKSKFEYLKHIMKTDTSAVMNFKYLGKFIGRDAYNN